MTHVQSFSFGRNWRSFSRFVSEDKISEAQADVSEWLGPQGVKGRSVIDIGCGSGIHSLAFHRLGATRLDSIDVDPHSVACTRAFRERAGCPPNWMVWEASILDPEAVRSLGTFDIVYSWGVLHHTGRMWDAIDIASQMAKPEGSRFFVSIYAKGPKYPAHLALKQRFNRWPWLVQRSFVLGYMAKKFLGALKRGESVGHWFWHERGMNAWHNAIDWFGGLPYEVASVEEMTAFLGERGWKLERLLERYDGGCSVYLFRRR